MSVGAVSFESWTDSEIVGERNAYLGSGLRRQSGKVLAI